MKNNKNFIIILALSLSFCKENPMTKSCSDDHTYTKVNSGKDDESEKDEEKEEKPKKKGFLGKLKDKAKKKKDEIKNKLKEKKEKIKDKYKEKKEKKDNKKKEKKEAIDEYNRLVQKIKNHIPGAIKNDKDKKEIFGAIKEKLVKIKKISKADIKKSKTNLNSIKGQFSDIEDWAHINDISDLFKRHNRLVELYNKYEKKKKDKDLEPIDVPGSKDDSKEDDKEGEDEDTKEEKEKDDDKEGDENKEDEKGDDKEGE